jgi:hypothetical protein
MPTAPDNRDAHDNAERIREPLPRRLQELREAAGFAKYGLARESGVSRERRKHLFRLLDVAARHVLLFPC